MRLALWTMLLILLLALLPIRISVRLQRLPADWGRTRVTVRWPWGLPLVRLRLQHAQLLAKWVAARRSAPNRIRGDPVWRPAADYLYHHIKVTMLQLLLQFGTGNMAATGVAVGAVQGGLGVLSAWLVRQPPFARTRPRLLVFADYVQVGLSLDVHCIMVLRPAHIIAASGIYVWTAASLRGRSWRQAWQQRGGRQRWPSIPFRA